MAWWQKVPWRVIGEAVFAWWQQREAQKAAAQAEKDAKDAKGAPK